MFHGLERREAMDLLGERIGRMGDMGEARKIWVGLSRMGARGSISNAKCLGKRLLEYYNVLSAQR